ncbi:MAG: hypothetical protein CM15mP120_10800 [Pseudomonadota bacterium]|nr:MAG: hypothetical protein CM15mP120_10800 [Pseudomonadota bacterium]
MVGEYALSALGIFLGIYAKRLWLPGDQACHHKQGRVWGQVF